MKIAGIEKLTTLDFPGHVAAVIFTPGCNFSCGFCHNPHLVDEGKLKEAMNDLVSEEAFFSFLDERAGMLEGVCISGGEPTLQPDLLNFVKKIKEKGFLVKIDTNGTNPKIIKELIDKKLVDFFAMDIKTCPEKYKDFANAGLFVDEVKKSKELIQSAGKSSVSYEFRTTVIKEIHTPEVLREIGEWVAGAENYYLQNFRNRTVLDEEYRKFSGFSNSELEEAKILMEEYVQHCGIRK